VKKTPQPTKRSCDLQIDNKRKTLIL